MSFGGFPLSVRHILVSVIFDPVNNEKKIKENGKYIRYSGSLPPMEEQPVPTWTAQYMGPGDFLRLRGYYKSHKERTIIAVPHVAPCDLAIRIVFLFRKAL